MNAVRAWNVCLTHDPCLAGLYRAVNDFSRGLRAPILSFDDGRIDRRRLGDADGAHRVPCGRSPLFRDCHLLSRVASKQGDELLRDANLLVAHSLFRAHVPWVRGRALLHVGRYWVVPHGCLDPWGLRRRVAAKRLWLSLWGIRCLADAEHVVFSSRGEHRKAHHWLTKDNGVVIHWPVDIPDLGARNERRDHFRGLFRIPSDARLLLSVGRLHSMKRPLAMLRAFAAGAADTCHLLVAGMDGDLTRNQVAAAVPEKVRKRVHVVGPLQGADLADAFLASDAFISLSYRENFGYALCDALAYGLPVIVTPGHDIVDDLPATDAGRLACGWLLPDDGLSAARAAIAEFSEAADEQLISTGAAGRAWAERHLSRSRFEEAVAALASSPVRPTGAP